MYYITLALQENLYVGLKKPNTNRTNTIQGCRPCGSLTKWNFKTSHLDGIFFFLVLCTSQNVVSSEGPKVWYQGEVERKLGCASSAI